MKNPVLDHGYVELVEHCGSDERIIEAARMSTGKGFLGWGPVLQCPHCYARSTDRGSEFSFCPACPAHPTLVSVAGDEKLLAHLWRNKHATPFEMAEIVIEVQAPIFVFREWHRHRTQSYNEFSARYSQMPNLNYVPDVERAMMVGRKNKQASAKEGAKELTEDFARNWLASLENFYEDAQRLYEDALLAGIPKELARLCIPVGRYSRMRAKANLRNWLAFLKLRMAPDAQWEIRQYAYAVAGIIKELHPRTWKLFEEEMDRAEGLK